MKKEKPSWAKTRVPWEIKKVIWRCWASGETKRDTVKVFEAAVEKYPGAPYHVDTIQKVRDELLALPIEWLDKLIFESPELEDFIKEIRPDYLRERTEKFIPQSPHSIELADTAILVAKDLDRYRKEPSCLGSPHTIRNAMFETSAVTELAHLDLIDKEKATDLLCHLKAEFPELWDLNDWCNLEDDLITASFVNRLELKAHEGKFRGRCPHCPK